MNQDADSVLAAANVLRELLRPIVEKLDAMTERLEAVEARPIGVIDRGVFTTGTTYAAGDGTTWDGGYWVCQVQTTEQPGEGCQAWRLAVHRGKRGPEGKRGQTGPPGRDAVEMSDELNEVGR
jgi:hypothetical protein